MAQPANDQFAERRPLTGAEATDTVSNMGATPDNFEPDPDSLSDTVWWGWVAPDDGICEVELLAADPSYRPVLAVGIGNPPRDWQLMGFARATNTATTKVRVAVVAGREYHLAAGAARARSSLHQWSDLTIRIHHQVEPTALLGNWHPAGWRIVEEGAGSWTSQAAVMHDGDDAAQAGFTPNLVSSRLVTSLDGPGRLSFWWKANAFVPVGNDAFYGGGIILRLNGSPMLDNYIQGQSDWRLAELILPEGRNEVVWATYGFFPFDLPAGVWLDQMDFHSTTPLKRLRASLQPEAVALDFLYDSQLPYELQSSTDLINWQTEVFHEELVGLSKGVYAGEVKRIVPRFQKIIPRSTNEPVTFYRAVAP